MALITLSHLHLIFPENDKPRYFIPTNTFKPVQKVQNFITGLQNIFKCLGDL